MTGVSSYSYAYNNPINYIDYYGLGPLNWLWKFLDKIGGDLISYSRAHDQIFWHGPGKKSKSKNNKNSNKDNHTHTNISNTNFKLKFNDPVSELNIPTYKHKIGKYRQKERKKVKNQRASDFSLATGEIITFNEQLFSGFRTYYSGKNPEESIKRLKQIANYLKMNRHIEIVLIVESGHTETQARARTIEFETAPGVKKVGRIITVTELRGKKVKETLIKNGVSESQVNLQNVWGSKEKISIFVK